MKKHTSAGYFDVGSRQSDGRHPHVETDVVVEKEPFAGRRAILQKRFFLDANGRLGTIFVQFVAAVSVALLTLFLLPISSIFIVDRFTIFVLREINIHILIQVRRFWFRLIAPFLKNKKKED